MPKKIGAGLLCLLFAALVYAAVAGKLGTVTQAVKAEASALASRAGFRMLAGVVAPDQPIQSLSGELPAHDATVGKLAGAAGTSGGAATYSIPIAPPPGRRGMQPSLSLDYSSRSGNGIAGMGWSLSGLSSIHRCPSTIDQDNSVRAVALDNSDKLCLDGQRLVATSGTTYGAEGTTYDTEIDSFVRVTQLGDDLESTDTYFKVETKSGEILWYGNNSQAPNPARVIPGGATVPLSWMLVRKQDRVGNFIRYAYTDMGNGEVLLNSVLYTGFTATGTGTDTDGDRHVDLTYEARPSSGGANDTASSYIAGALTLQTQRLKQITTYVGTQPVRQYALRFDAPSQYSGRSLLRGVKECGFADGSTLAICRPETTFAWQESTLKSKFHALTFDGLPTDIGPMSSLTQVGDVDGDGVPELLAVYDTTPSRQGSKYLISVNADGSTKSVMEGSPFGSDYDSNGPTAARNTDFNKDGRTDVLGLSYIDGSFHITDTVWNDTTKVFRESAFTSYDLGVSAPQVCAIQSADLNGDGFTDLILATPIGAADCGYFSRLSMSVYLGKASSSPGVPAVQTTPAYTMDLPYVVNPADQHILTYRPAYTTDFDGDGLADVILTRQSKYAFGPQYSQVPSERDKAEMLLFSRVTDQVVNGMHKPVYNLGGSGNEYDTFGAFTGNPAQPLVSNETNQQAFTQMADVNGDGLPDLISIKIQSDHKGYWSVRLNTGGRWGPRMVTSSRRGIETCSAEAYIPGTTFAWGQCTDRWQPTFTPLLTTGDTDHDGRAELLAPRAFAARICMQTTNELPSHEYYDTFICPQNPLNGQRGPMSPDMALDPSNRLQELYHGYARVADGSAYYMDAVHFVQTSPSTMDAVQVHTPIIYSNATTGSTFADASRGDFYGRGLMDSFAAIGLPVVPPSHSGLPFWTSYAFIYPDDAQWGPATLPDDPVHPTSVGDFGIGFHWESFISEDQGTGLNPDGKTPEQADLMLSATDGLGAKTIWTYYPLSSSAGRSASDTPLYSVPGDPAARYVDDRNVYFTSTMPVVSDMANSDGIGGFHSIRYGYSEAMYQTHGRGFQGFRTITEEDLTAGLRTTTIFNQKFPLVSKVQEVFVNALTRNGTNAAIKHTVYTWSCDRNDRTNQDSCVQSNGTAAIVFPFLGETDTSTFDAAVALKPTGTPLQIGYVREINADDPSCNGAISGASGFDAYGNLTAHTVLNSDSGNGTGVFRSFVAQQCVNTESTYVANTTNWWLDKLTSTTTTSAVAYDATNHPLPAGTSNLQAVTTSYVWNGDRTLQKQTVQASIASQKKVTVYVYPDNVSSTNYGLPSGIAIAAGGDLESDGSQRTRSSGIAYSNDGYFPVLATNPLQQTTKVTTRARDGQPSLTIDVNGLRTLMTYDAFGQLIDTQFHGASDAVQRVPDKQSALAWCHGSCTPDATALYKSVVVQDGAPTQVVTYDMLGRALVTGQKLQDGKLSQVQTVYDALGRVQQQSAPVKTLSSDQPWTQFEYDPLNRVTQKIVPKGADDGRGDLVTTYSYHGLQTAIEVCGTNDTDDNNCLDMTRTTDSMGRYMETVDSNNGVTQYWYDASGNTLALVDANGSVTTASYNAVGQRTSVNDPNQGLWSFQYDALGEVLTQTDARNVVTTTTYDPLGRPLMRNAAIDVTGDGVVDNVADSWTYDPRSGNGNYKGIGEVATSQRMVYASQGATGTIERSQIYKYDILARPIETDTHQQIAAGSYNDYVQTVDYDAYYGRPKSTVYPNGETVATWYSKYGQPTVSYNPDGDAVYRSVWAVDDRGDPTVARLGGLINTDTGTVTSAIVTDTRVYRPSSGELTGIAYTHGVSLRQLDYKTDVYGNLTEQRLNRGATVEDFTYDALQRMTQAARSGAVNASIAYSYDKAGNFTYKTDFSSTLPNAYAYTGGSCGGGPNAVKTVQLATGGSRTYCYDANGNLTSDNAGLAVQYDHDNLPVKTVRGAATINLYYGPDNQHTREVGSDGTKVYLDGGYEDWISQGSTKVYVGTEAEITTTSSGRTVNYLLTDRLGSVDAIASSTETLVETRGSDAFGKPRSGTWADLSPPQLQSIAITAKGFTEHEHLNSVQLIHMNGRVYDYQLGRFLSVDPFIQFPLNSQSLNPYSYIMNNPLAGTDPTGYQEEDAGGDGDPDIHDKKLVTGSRIAGAMSGQSLQATGGSFTQLANDAPSIGQNPNGAVNGASVSSSSAVKQRQQAGGSGIGGNSTLPNSAIASPAGGNTPIGSGQTDSSPDKAVGCSPAPCGYDGGYDKKLGGRTTIIVHEDGTIEKRTGHIPWRDNNPGDIKDIGAFGKNHDAIGTDISGKNKFLIFLDQKAGDAAMSALLDIKANKGLDLAKTISAWAPPSENDTAAYQRAVSTAVGLPLTTKLSTFTASQKESLMNSIKSQEGYYDAGTITIQK